MSYIDNVRQAYIDGMSLSEIENRFNISQGRINYAIRDIRGSLADGVRRKFIRDNKIHFEKVIKLFNDGFSVNKIHKTVGIQRSTVNRILEINGMEPRSRSDAEKLKWSQMSEKQRKNQVKAAHKRCDEIGYTHLKNKSNEHLHKTALNRFISHSEVGISENNFAKWIMAKNLPCVQQAPIRGYNIDALVGNIAVEIHNSTTAPHFEDTKVRRIKYLLNSGFYVLYIKIQSSPLIIAAADYTEAFFNFASSNKSTFTEYRMIRGNGDFMTAMRFDGNHLSDIPSPHQF